MENATSHLKISESGMTETAYTSAGFKPTKPQSTAATARDASLDGLPAELKISILRSAPDIPALETLVRSSPLYRKVYLDERKVIIPAVLLRHIGTEVLLDALAVYKASHIEFDESGRREDSVKSFITRYKAERGSTSPATCDSLDIRTLESLSRLQSVVAKITFDFNLSCSLRICSFNSPSLRSNCCNRIAMSFSVLTYSISLFNLAKFL